MSPGGQTYPWLRTINIEIFARDSKVTVSKPDVFKSDLDKIKCAFNLSKA